MFRSSLPGLAAPKDDDANVDQYVGQPHTGHRSQPRGQIVQAPRISYEEILPGRAFPLNHNDTVLSGSILVYLAGFKGAAKQLRRWCAENDLPEPKLVDATAAAWEVYSNGDPAVLDILDSTLATCPRFVRFSENIVNCRAPFGGAAGGGPMTDSVRKKLLLAQRQRMLCGPDMDGPGMEHRREQWREYTRNWDKPADMRQMREGQKIR